MTIGSPKAPKYNGSIKHHVHPISRALAISPAQLMGKGGNGLPSMLNSQKKHMNRCVKQTAINITTGGIAAIVSQAVPIATIFLVMISLSSYG